MSCMKGSGGDFLTGRATGESDSTLYSRERKMKTVIDCGIVIPEAKGTKRKTERVLRLSQQTRERGRKKKILYENSAANKEGKAA